jgi:hypothetical protein
VSEFVERYRRNAEQCLRLVQNFTDPDAKRSLLAMANAWLVLAAQREKNVEAASAHEPTSPINEPPPPPDEPPTPPPIDEPKPPTVSEPPPVNEPPQRLNAAEPDGSIKPDDSMQS